MKTALCCLLLALLVHATGALAQGSPKQTAKRLAAGPIVTTDKGQVGPGADPHLLPRINVPGGALKLALALHRDHFLVTPTSASGSQVASSGNKVISAIHSTIMKKNGREASAT